MKFLNWPLFKMEKSAKLLNTDHVLTLKTTKSKGHGVQSLHGFTVTKDDFCWSNWLGVLEGALV